jgi:hypothetical protein
MVISREAPYVKAESINIFKDPLHAHLTGVKMEVEE